MGGSIDTFGNTGPWAEFNIQIDPEAFNIVLNAFQTEDKRSLVIFLKRHIKMFLIFLLLLFMILLQLII